MELLGIWRLKQMLTVKDGGFVKIGRAEIEALPDDEGNHEYKQLLRADFIISETSLNVFYMPLEEEMEMAKEEGLEITENGVLLDSFPSKIEDGKLLLNYERDGAEYFPVEIDETGALIISDGLLIIEKRDLVE